MQGRSIQLSKVKGERKGREVVTVAVCSVDVGWEPTKQNRRGVASPRHLRREDEKGFLRGRRAKLGLCRYVCEEASGRLRCVRVLSYPDRRNVLDPGCLDGGDAATCPGLLKVNAESVRVLSDPDRRNVLDLGNLDGGDAATCPGILYLGPELLHLGLNCLWAIICPTLPYAGLPRWGSRVTAFEPRRLCQIVGVV
ncbi:hypothetical protein AgCh_004855 [Apium graveolens]